MSGQAPGQAESLQPGEIMYLYHWRFARGEEFGLFRHAADADAMAAKHAGAEVLSMAVLDRPQSQAAPELAAAMAESRELRAIIVDALALIAVLADGNPAAQRQANELRRRAGVAESPAAGGERPDAVLRHRGPRARPRGGPQAVRHLAGRHPPRRRHVRAHVRPRRPAAETGGLGQ